MRDENQKRKKAPTGFHLVQYADTTIHTTLVAHPDKRIAQTIALAGGGEYLGSQTSRVTGRTTSRRPQNLFTEEELNKIRSLSTQEFMTLLREIPLNGAPAARPGPVKARPAATPRKKKAP